MAADPAKPHRFSVVSSANPAAGSMVAMGRHQPGRIGLRKGFDGQVIVNTQFGEPKTP